MPQFHRQEPRLFSIATRAKHHELFTAKPAEYVRTPQTLADTLAEAAQHMIPHGMTVLVVDPLEMVDVEHDHCQFLIITLGAVQFGL
ncbi:hypothetical protein D3C79_988000 [compost metagenome]